MVKHIVMWKLKDYAAGASRAENARRLKARLEALPAVIPELKRLEVGLNFNPSEAAYDVVLYSEFESRTALAVYQRHPEHQRLITEFLDHVRIDKRVVDYEVDEV